MRQAALTSSGRAAPAWQPAPSAPAAWVSRSGVFAIGIAPAEPAELTVRHSASPSTDDESTTMNAPTVLNAVPLATVSSVAPWTFAVPVVVEVRVDGGHVRGRRTG